MICALYFLAHHSWNSSYVVVRWHKYVLFYDNKLAEAVAQNMNLVAGRMRLPHYAASDGSGHFVKSKYFHAWYTEG